MTPLTTDLLREAADRWGTPLYVTDLDAASAAASAWRVALPEALIAYAVKANPDPALLRRLADDGFGFEVVGPIELALALRAGATGREQRGERSGGLGVDEGAGGEGIGQVGIGLADAVDHDPLFGGAGALDERQLDWPDDLEAETVIGKTTQ